MTFLPRSGVLGALALVVALGLVGCGGDDDGKDAGPGPSDSASATASDSASAQPSFDPMSPLSPAPGVPTDFPTADVPLIPGSAVQPAGAGDAERGWVLEISSTKSRQDCFDEAVAALLAKGFRLSAGPNVSKENIEALYLSPGYRVIVTATSRDDACSVGYEVATNASPAPQ